MTEFQSNQTTCGTLLYDLQLIWDEVGEPDSERDRMLLQLEQECLEVYRRKVDQASRARAQLRQTIADCEAELAAICATMGERPLLLKQSDQKAGSLKEEVEAMLPQLEEMRKRKVDRINQFSDVLGQIQKISREISGSTLHNSSKIIVDESDLSLRKLEEFHNQLQALQKEKSDRLKQVMEHMNSLSGLCAVLGMDFLSTVREVHPSLEDSEASKCISNETIDRLANAIQKLREVKIQRMQKLQDLATTMLELWNLMDTPVEEQQVFQSVTCNIAAKEHEINEPNNLSVDFINYVEAEVARLEELKESKMKELVLKKRTELEEICRKTHVDADEETTMEYAVAAIESGTVDPSCILEQIEAQIAKVKEDAFSRKEILDKVDKWLVACDEENWLEDYNKDENRYNAGRGAHLTLKRAEKARAAVSKIPATVEALVVKTTVWERERGKEFMYNGVRLLSMLEDYNILRQEKEQERKRQRDQKKLQGQLIAEQEALFGSKPSPSKTPSARKLSRTSTGSTNRRLSLGGPMMHTQTLDFLPPTKASAHGARQTKKAERPHSSHNHHQDDSFAALSAGRRGLDIAGLPARKQSLYSTNNPEPETPSTQRKPFSPVSTKPNTASNSLLDDHVKLQNINFAKNAPIKTTNLPSTPSTNKHQISATDEENRTPQSIAVPFLNTPSSVSMPMQTAMTPMHMVSATPAALFGHVQRSPAEIEYSFEERRAGFVYCQ